MGGNFAHKIALFVTVPLLAHFSTSSALGQWAIAFSIFQVLPLILDVGLSKAAARIVYQSGVSLRALTQAYTSARATITVGVAAVAALALSLGWQSLTEDVIPVGTFLPMLVVYGIAEAFLLGALSIFRASRHPVDFGLVRLIQAVVLVIGCTLFVRTHGALGAAASLTGGTVLAAMIAAGRLYVMEKLGANPPPKAAVPPVSILRNLLAYGAPLVIYDVSWWLRSASGPVILAGSANLGQIGAYALGLTAFSAMSVLISTADGTYTPYYFEWRRSASWEERARKVFDVLTSACAAATIAAAVAAPHVFRLLKNEIAHDATRVAWIALSATPSMLAYYFFVKPYYYNKKTFKLSVITTGCSLIGIVAAVFVVPRWAHLGLSCVLATTFIVLSAVAFLRLEKEERGQFQVRTWVLYQSLLLAYVAFCLATEDWFWLQQIVGACGCAVLMYGLLARFLAYRRMR